MSNLEDKAEHLKIALFLGQHAIVEKLLSETPNLGRANLGLACALYDKEFVLDAVSASNDAAKAVIGIRSPMCHLAFSKHIHGGGNEQDMLAVAAALVDAGGDVNDFYNYNGDPNAPLSVLYGALGHANNMALARWLLEHGANPNDGESLYHATELGHRDGLRLLLEHRANPAKTNAIPRALDFNDHEAVEMLLAAGADPNEGIDAHPSGEPSFVIPALHQAARRMCDAKMVALLLDAGADPSMRYKGLTPYAMARVYGNKVAADLIGAAGGDADLSDVEKVLASAADDSLASGARVDETQLNPEYQSLIRNLVHLPDTQGHIRRLIKVGLDPNRPDEMGLPPLHIAGWEGLPDAMEFFLGRDPDLGHVNNYGGDLLATIIHGSENCPNAENRNHVECARMALSAGVSLPRATVAFAGQPLMANFLSNWAAEHPDRVVDGGDKAN